MKKVVRLPFEPRSHQREAHELRKRWSVLVWHRRSGKTVFSIIELLLAGLNFKRRAGRFAYVAPFYGQAKQVSWDYLKYYALTIPGVVIRESELTIVLPNGATIRLYGADKPDTLRGLYFDGIVLDEVADMKPQVWGEIVRPALADREGWALFIGTPKGINLFSDLYHQALRDDAWYADLRRASETDAITKEELEAARKQMTPNQYAQEMECDFSAAVENALISLGMVREAAGRTIARLDHSYASVVLGVDIARYGDDRSVIFPRQGLAAFKPYVFRQLSTMAMAAQVAHVYDELKADAALIDEGAMGPGVIDKLRQMGGYNVIGINFGGKATNPRYVNIRSEIWDKMAGWIKEGGCIPDDESLVADLCGPTYSFDNAANKFELETKESMKKRGLASPDLGDGLALTFAVPIAKRPELEAFKQFRGDPYRVQTEYDVLG